MENSISFTTKHRSLLYFFKLRIDAQALMQANEFTQSERENESIFLAQVNFGYVRVLDADVFVQ